MNNYGFSSNKAFARDNSVDPRLITAVILIFLISVATFVVGYFDEYADKLLKQEMLVLQFENQIDDLNNLKTKSLATIIDRQTLEKFKAIESNIDKIAADLYENELSQKPQIMALYNEYRSSVNNLFELIQKGENEKAKILDETKIVPIFNSLKENLDHAGIYFEKDSYRENFVKTGFTLIITFIFALVVLTFFLLNRYLNKTRMIERAHWEANFILNSANQGMCIVDHNHSIISVNEAFVNIPGIASDPVGKRCIDVFGCSFCKKDECIIRQCFNTNNTIEQIIERKGLGASLTSYIVTAFTIPLSNAGKNVILSFKDITKFKETEKLLLKYKMLIDNARDNIFYVNNNGQIMEANEAAVKTYGYKKEELLNLKIFDLLAPTAQVLSEYQLSVAYKEGILFEHLHIKKDGTIFPVEVSLKGAVINEEQILLSIIRDITDRKKDQEALLEQKRFAENLVENNSIPTFVLDPNHNVIIWNEACERLTGVEKSIVIGTDGHLKAIYKNTKPCLADIIINNYSDNSSDNSSGNEFQSSLQEEIWFEDIGGQSKWLLAYASAIFNNKGKLMAVIETLQDITKIKRAEQTLKKHNDLMLQELELAAKVQRELLPTSLHLNENIDVYWEFNPSVFIAGDMFNIFNIDDDHIGFYILDVKGHGIQSALKAVTLSYLLKPSFNLDEGQLSLPSEILKDLNKKFFDENDPGNFFTMFYGVLNTQTNILTYARAGHCSPIVICNGKEITQLSKGGPALGIMNRNNYQNYSICLKSGDKIILYTDGILEAYATNEDSGIQELINTIHIFKEDGVATIIKNICAKISSKMTDDITIMGIEIKN